MAENVVETILVKLGLDASSYNQDADKAVKKNEQLNKSIGDTDKIVATVGKTLGKFFSVIATATGIAKLIDDVQRLNDELYHLEKNLGMSSTTIKAWQGAAGAMGGSADGMTGSMKSLNMAMNDFVVTGDSAMLPYMNALGVSMVGANGKLKDTSDVMLDLADSFSKMDREQAFSIASKMSIDEGTFNTLVQGRQEMEKMIEYQKTMYQSSEAELQVSRDLAKNRALLGQQWESMKTMMGNILMPLFLKMSEVLLGMFDYLQEHQQEVKAVFTGLAFIVGAVLTPVLIKAAIAAAAFLAPILLAAAPVIALGAAFGLLYDDYKTWAEGGQSLFNWGVFKDYIDGAKMSTENLRKAFSDLAKDMLKDTIPTLTGYAEILNKLMSGDFTGAAAQAKEMIGNFSERVTGYVDTAMGNEQGTLSDAIGEEISKILNGDTEAGVVNGTKKSTLGKKGWKLGQTSSKFETGGRGAGTVSTGKGDKGGVSYGSYQMSSNMGVVQDFLKTSGYGNQFNGLSVNSEGFKKKWKDLAKNDPKFGDAQHDYIKRTHYDVLMKKLSKSGIDISGRGAAVQDALWSTSVQFGGNTSLVNKALAGRDISKMSDADIVKAVQQYKAKNTKSLFKSSPKLWGGLRNRAIEEEKALLKLHGSGASSPAAGAQQSIRQGANQIPSNMRSASVNNRIDTKIGDINVYTTASTITGVAQDAAGAFSNQIGMMTPSLG